ncbi:hypothetical protein [Paracoccus marinaquae]|uniref:Uncharacterized protein n=1 Tax=Paracoccus marinaquae TaxID=2841926 RepID=A0ABS6AH43_9RHOB|nr:hypothetical protein [Paracoccus marinaquae]MBU3029442.1 hypothetical protein [Paracoccus marinaquae]
MSADAFGNCLSALKARAEEANRNEIRHQQEAARRAAELRDIRAFAWRRLNILRAVAAAVRGEAEEEPALLAGQAAMLRDTGLNLATQPRRDLAERFRPVTRAVWLATREEAEDAAAEAALAAFAEFEAWHLQDRETPFLALMEREIPELPLVEV